MDALPYANCLELGELPGLYFVMSGAELFNQCIHLIYSFSKNPVLLPHVRLDLNILQIKIPSSPFPHACTYPQLVSQGNGNMPPPPPVVLTQCPSG